MNPAKASGCGKVVVVSKRNPDQTRARILQAAFEEMRRNGFRAASVDQILADTGLTKGALYHHFPNKAALGHAVVDELIGASICHAWIEPLQSTKDPIAGLLQLLESIPPEKLAAVAQTGCPLNNLALEMSPVDDDFRQRIEAVFRAWREGVAERLRAGQEAGYVAADVDCEQAATFFVASIEGAMGLAKNARDSSVLLACVCGIRRYLESLRPAA
ncbi:MAG: TetR family transcriptional regulator [Acidobacteria bacterium]|nr:TetR family transcriptional regulator [Acidobacteriota bacterium]